ncbi:MAG: helix-turn-helix transcriptional regulator [Chroococcidiopsidaceae cyanobacterium CP_BM_RX_35]|nr:helix-turn-helix transcriptional regulator [Chroococcidiopsidaceae cyanobacterium CP_BM_RX_35]
MKNIIKPFLDGLGISPYRFWHAAGISRVTAYKLYNDPTYIPGADVLVKICDTYQIQPGAILFWMSDDEGDDQKALVNQEKLQDLEQGGERDEMSPPHRHQRARSFLAVVQDIPESA